MTSQFQHPLRRPRGAGQPQSSVQVVTAAVRWSRQRSGGHGPGHPPAGPGSAAVLCGSGSVYGAGDSGRLHGDVRAAAGVRVTSESSQRTSAIPSPRFHAALASRNLPRAWTPPSLKEATGIGPASASSPPSPRPSRGQRREADGGGSGAATHASGPSCRRRNNLGALLL